MKGLVLGFVVAVFVLLSGCTKDADRGQTFLLPWGPVGGQVQFKKVKIQTITSPYEASGPAADVYLRSEMTSAGFVGDKAKPKLTKSGNVFIPKDVESSMALVTYAHMERLKAFDESLGFSNRVYWPRQVGLQVELKNSIGGVVDNNAAYFGDYDLTAFFPMSLRELPMSINGGIIAHEHFHAHFQQFGLKPNFSHLGLRRKVFNDRVIIRGWNEGLADFYAYVYTDNTDFLSLSLPNQQLRSLEATPFSLRPTESLFPAFMKIITDIEGIVGCLAYPLGTQYALLFKSIADQGLNGQRLSNKRQLLKYIMIRLSELQEEFAANPDLIPSQQLAELIFDDFSLLNMGQRQTLNRLGFELNNESWKEVYPCTDL